MKILNMIADGPKAEQINAWEAEIRLAETEASESENAKWRLFLVSYRVASSPSKSKGDDAARRSTLVKLVEAMQPRERHLSTSTFILRTRIAEAKKLIDLLCKPLDKSIDFLHVAQIDPKNRDHWGHNDIEP